MSVNISTFSYQLWPIIDFVYKAIWISAKNVTAAVALSFFLSKKINNLLIVFHAAEWSFFVMITGTRRFKFSFNFSRRQLYFCPLPSELKIYTYVDFESQTPTADNFRFNHQHSANAFQKLFLRLVAIHRAYTEQAICEREERHYGLVSRTKNVILIFAS